MVGAANNANPAHGLAGATANGQITIHAEVAKRGLTLCRDAIAAVLAINASADTVSDLEPFSNLRTGTQLAEKFSKKAEDLSSILTLHVNILNDIADTFKAAAREFATTDAASKAEFDRIAMPTAPGNIGPGLTPPDPNKPSPGWENPKALIRPYVKSEDFSNFKGETDNWKVGREVPSEIRLYKYRGLAHSIRPDYLAYVSSTWKQMAKSLDDTFRNFRRELKHFDGQWQGHGKDRAEKALTQYAKMTESVAYDVRWIGSNLADAGNWLGSTRAKMLTMWALIDSTSGSRNPTEDIRPKFYPIIEGFYNPGLQASSTSVPILRSPKSPVVGVPGTSGQPGTGGRGNGAGGKTGGGSNRMRAPGSQRRNAAQIPLGQRPVPVTEPPPTEPPPDEIRTGPAYPGDPGRRITADIPIYPSPPQKTPDDPPNGTPNGTPQGIPQGMLQGLDQALQSAQRATQSGLPPTTPANVQPAAADPTGAKLGGPGPGPGGPGPGVPNDPLTDARSRLFPRSSLPTPAVGTEMANAARAGLPPAPGTAGSPGAAGAPGAGQGQGQGYKRLHQLNTKDNFEEAMGDPQLVSEPVVGQ